MADKVTVPLPCWVKLPVPEITLAIEMSSDRLKINEALLTTLPAPNVPLVPPLPICSAPAEMVVVPP